jgi:hypothetical protein
MNSKHATDLVNLTAAYIVARKNTLRQKVASLPFLKARNAQQRLLATTINARIQELECLASELKWNDEIVLADVQQTKLFADLDEEANTSHEDIVVRPEDRSLDPTPLQRSVVACDLCGSPIDTDGQGHHPWCHAIAGERE